MKKILNLFLVILFFIEESSSQDCVIQDLCKYKTLADKMKFYVSPLSNGCDYDKYSVLANFLFCVDADFSNCGFITNSDRGVKIGLGIDLSKVSKETLTMANINSSVIEKLSPYIGLTGLEAENALRNKNLILEVSDAQQLTSNMISYYNGLLSSEYDQDCKDCSLKFSHLSVKIKATLLSLYFNLNGIRGKDTELWNSILKNDWDSVANMIQKMKHPILRRKAEYLNLKSGFSKCERKTETLILYGNNGLISKEKFEVMRKFFLNYINMTDLMTNTLNFATANIQNFTIVQDHFSFYKGELYPLVENETTLPFVQDYYNLPLAIEKGIDIFKNDSYVNETKKTIVIISNRGEGGVDDENWTTIKEKSDLARKNDIKIVAILQDYIPHYYDRMLQIVGNESWNIINNNKEYESEFICSNVTLYSKICTYFNDEIRINSNNQTLTGYVKSFESPQFYTLKFEKSNRLQRVSVLPINDLFRDVKVNVFLSYVNPYPDNEINDIEHLGSNKGSKELVIGPNNNTDDSQFNLYVGVYSDMLAYNITFTDCVQNDDSCKVGTNESDVEPGEGLPGWAVGLIVLFFFLVAIGIAFAVYQFIQMKRNRNNDFLKFNRIE